MELNNLSANAKVSVYARKAGKQALFEQRIVDLTPEDQDYLDLLAQIKDYCVIERVTHGGRVVNLDVPGMVYNLVGTVDRKPFCWRNVSIHRRTLPRAGEVEIVCTRKAGVKFERRNHTRTGVSIDGIFTSNREKTPEPLMVRDISISGIGLIMSQKKDMKIGDRLHIQYRDKIYNGRAVESTELFNLDAVVVRMKPLTEGRVLVGCMLKNQNVPMLNKYITSKRKMTEPRAKRA